MKLMSTAAVAQRLRLTPDCVRYHERQGHILAITVERGENSCMRLYVEQDIERFEQQREARKQDKIAKRARKLQRSQDERTDAILEVVPPDD
jgi:DNA-binding transcriptional MerR regulator